MENFYNELKYELERRDKTLDDIEWVGILKDGEYTYFDNSMDKDVYLDLEQFFRVADFDYWDGFGSAEITLGLVVVGKDWWLERHEYDGSEWWEFKTLPKKPDVLLEGTDDYIKSKIYDP